MCGEIDETIEVNLQLLERFKVMTRMLGLEVPESVASGPRGLADPKGRAAYMEQIFQLGLMRALKDAQAAEEDETVDAIASQAIAFARLAGFIAGQLPPDADLFRAVIEAVTTGHSETAKLQQQYRSNQAEAHGHDHDHGHHHPHDEPHRH
ncbi:hypothetical protein [Labrenzia sp. OB1]|uniref:hypothetical protein n=1 Tax=Labrenzia sp. OB1 TaxID=1561204 RepID=UPI0007B27710|nr:hypothetical protein [Labrenzia sp. OB1]KZM49551.1 hypothetical protein OA90_13760 [Labrenzia sp. OB1]